jgi:hypothetical protein
MPKRLKLDSFRRAGFVKMYFFALDSLFEAGYLQAARNAQDH